MALREWFRPPRHLLVMFFGITVISASTLGGLSWQLVRQDRDLATKRAEETRDNIAGLAAVELQSHLSEAEERLTALASLPEDVFSTKAAEYFSGIPGDSAFLVIRPDGVDTFPPGRLLYYPYAPTATQAPPEKFAEVDAVEYREKDRKHAIELLRELSTAPEPLVRAEALRRLGGNLQQTLRWQEAIVVYKQLASLGAIPIAPLDRPAELIAQGAIIKLLKEHDAKDQLSEEADALWTALHNGRWRITAGVYDEYAKQAREALSPAIPRPPDEEAVLLSDVAQFLWEQNREKTVSSRQTFWSADQSRLLIQRGSEERLLALAVGPGMIQSQWLKEAQSAVPDDSIRIALEDDGRAVIGLPDAAPNRQSVRLASGTGLPWTVYAISTSGFADARPFTVRSWLVLSGAGAIALLVLGGSYLIGRAVSRELAVARLQSDFVSAVSHEFRTPLTVLRQLSELLVQERVPDDSTRKQYYVVLEQESSRLHRLVEGLLKFGRMEAGVVRYQFEALDTTALLRTLVDEFSREASRHGCHVELDANGSVPPALADREALGCVIWNLLDNAVKYSPDCRTVWVNLATENGQVAIHVRDQGVGIPPVDQRRIFDKFVRGAVATMLGVQGTGIGLAVARQIVLRHGGEIRVQSEEGKGSTFTVLLPAAT
jgi:signal transduction histidine kinase